MIIAPTVHKLYIDDKNNNVKIFLELLVLSNRGDVILPSIM